MNHLWEQIVRTAMAGAGRSPLPAAAEAALRLPAGADATQAALLGMAAAQLLRKAAGALPDRLAGVLPPPCPPDKRPCCTPAAVRDLNVMLAQGAFREALPEFFRLLSAAGQRLPPEALPGVLDFLERSKTPDSEIRAAIEPAASWLARQNPHWTDLLPREAADWDTGSFAERRALLADARRTHPLVGAAWLEKTWAKERPEHRLRFLETLRQGLSPTDEPLLERARLDKSHPVRLEACRLLLCLPDSQLSRLAQTVFDALAAGPAQPNGLIRRLEDALPAEGPFSTQSLIATTGQTAVPAAGWLALAPLNQLAAACGLRADAWLAALATAPEPWLDAALDRIAWEGQPENTTAALHFFQARPEHPLQRSESLAAILQALPEAEWLRHLPLLARHDRLLEAPDTALVRALCSAPQPWPKDLLEAVLRYPQRNDKPRHWAPPPHFRTLLQQAAYRCAPADAETLAQSMPGGAMPYAWQSELMQFWSVVRFRRQFQIHLNPGPNNSLPANGV